MLGFILHQTTININFPSLLLALYESHQHMGPSPAEPGSHAKFYIQVFDEGNTKFSSKVRIIGP